MRFSMNSLLFTFLSFLLTCHEVYAIPPNHRTDRYLYDGANKVLRDCSTATKDDSFVVNNNSGVVIYYDLTTPGQISRDYQSTPNAHTVWCHVKTDEKNAIVDFDFNLDEPGIQMRSYYLRPGNYYYFTLNGSNIMLQNKKLKSLSCGGSLGSCKYELEP